MADKEIVIKTASDNPGGWTGFWIAYTLIMIAFWGDPDLIDALIFGLMEGCTP